MLATEAEIDYLVLYGKARQKIRALELQLERLITKHSHEMERLKSELNNPKIKSTFDKKDLINDLLLEVCKVTGTTAGQLMGPSRERDVVTARHLFWYIARHEYNFNWSKMTNLLDRHHSTAIHGAAQYANYLNFGYKGETKMYKMVMLAMKQHGGNNEQQ